MATERWGHVLDLVQQRIHGCHRSTPFLERTAWAGCQAADRRAAGRHAGGDPWPRRGPPEGGAWPRCRAWRSPLEAGEQADHHQEAWATVRTALTRLEG